MPAPFQIKICGITTVEDALQAVDAGADALGLNFYEKSSRYIGRDVATEIGNAVVALDPNVYRVGVFVNASWSHLQAFAHEAGLHAIQLHGDEPPELIAGIHHATIPHQVVRAFRVRSESLDSIQSYLRDCGAELPVAALLDAFDPSAYGGTGKRLDWELVRRERAAALGLPIILAGGLTPENVAEAIATARPDAVDVAGGVESAPGRKDPAKVAKFVAEARMAFDRLR